MRNLQALGQKIIDIIKVIYYLFIMLKSLDFFNLPMQVGLD